MFENEKGVDILTTCRVCGHDVISTLYGSDGLPIEAFEGCDPSYVRPILYILGRCKCGGDVKHPPTPRLTPKVVH